MLRDGLSNGDGVELNLDIKLQHYVSIPCYSFSDFKGIYNSEDQFWKF